MIAKVKKIPAGMLVAIALGLLEHGAAAPLTITRTMVYRQLTSQSSNVSVRGQPVLSDSGIRAAFAGGDPTRVFLLDADANNLAEVDAYPNVVDLQLDLTFFGGTVVSSDGRRIRLASAGNAARELLTLAAPEIGGLQISGGGSYILFLIRHDTTLQGKSTTMPRGLYRLTTDSASVQSVVNAGQVATTFGIAPGDVLGFELSGPALDFAGDTSRVVFGTTNRAIGQVLLGANADGTGLHAILTPAPPTPIECVAISSDGSQVAYCVGGSSPSVGVIRFDATSPRTLWTPQAGMAFPASGDGLTLSSEGSLLLAGGTGLLLNTDGSGVVQLSVSGRRLTADPPSLINGTLPSGTMNPRASRFLYLYADANSVDQLALLELDPASFNSAPEFSAATVSPEYVLQDAGSSATVSAGLLAPAGVYRVSLAGLRSGLDDAYLGHLILHDDGRNGDATAGDWTFSDNGLTAGSGAAVGPRSLRIQAEGKGADGRQHATAVELAPFFVLASPPGTSAPTLSSLDPDRGVPGTQVTILGASFDAAFGHNQVLFGNRLASVLSGNGGTLVVVVPGGLSQGPVSVTVSANGRTSNPLPFTVLGPRIEVPSAPVDFGRVPVGQTANRSFLVRNPGGAPLRVTRFNLSGNAFQGISPGGPFTLQPGETMTFTIAFAPATEGTATGSLSVVSDDPTTPVASVQLVGVGLVPKIEVPAAPVDFGNVTAGQTSQRSFLIRNVGGAPLNVTQTTLDNDQFSAISPQGPFAVPAGSQQSFTIAFAPTSPGPVSGTLTLINNDPTMPAARVQLVGVGAVPDIEVTPTVVDFGAVAVGQHRDLSVEIHNAGNAALSVAATPTSNTRFRATSPARPFDVAPGATVLLNVRFSPCSGDAQTGSLQIQSNDPDEGVVTLGLKGRGEPSTELVVTLNGRGGQFITWDDGAGWVQTIDMNVDVTFEVLPRTPVRDGNWLHSTSAEFKGSLHIWGEATDRFFGATEVFQFDHDLQLYADRLNFHTYFRPTDGQLLRAEANLVQFWHSDQASAYSFYFDASQSAFFMWIEVPGLWNYPDRPSTDELYQFPGSACVSGFTSGLAGRVIDACSGSAIPHASVSVNALDGTYHAETDAAGRFSMPRLSSGAAQQVISAAGYESTTNTIQLPPLQTLTRDFPLQPKETTIDLRRQDNSKAHHTEGYGARNRLILRRGATFECGWEMAPGQEIDSYELAVEVIDETDAQRPTNTIACVSGPLAIDQWSAQIKPPAGGGTVAPITINIPANAAVGEYSMALRFRSRGSAQVACRQAFPLPLVVLFNPWCDRQQPAEPVFVGDEDKVKEYVDREGGLLYRYGAQQCEVGCEVAPRAWIFGQYEPIVLEKTLELLRGAADRADPLAVATQFARNVRLEPDDVQHFRGGFLYACWDWNHCRWYKPTGDPCQVMPGDWIRTKDVLEHAACAPARYGQCWVFAGALTGMLRCAGIPARPVTALNVTGPYGSGPDRTVDWVFLPDGRSEREFWNFHTWCELWARTPEAGPNNPWHLVDPTYGIGPLALQSIRWLNYFEPIQGPFDDPLAFAHAEVAYPMQKKFLHPVTHVPIPLDDPDPFFIGKYIVTKPEGERATEPEDITSLDFHGLELT